MLMKAGYQRRATGMEGKFTHILPYGIAVILGLILGLMIMNPVSTDKGTAEKVRAGNAVAYVEPFHLEEFLPEFTGGEE